MLGFLTIKNSVVPKNTKDSLIIKIILLTDMMSLVYVQRSSIQFIINDPLAKYSACRSLTFILI